MSDTIGFGFVGAGRMAAVMARAIGICPRARIVGVSASSPESARAFAGRFGVPVAHRDNDALLADPAVDIVYVATPTRAHAAASIAALEAGKAVLCEKPFALDVAEGRRVLDAARASGRFFMEALWTLALPAYRHLDSLVESRAFGAPAHLAFAFGYPVLAAERPRVTAPEDGGVLFDRGCYGVALALRHLGPVERIHAALSADGGRADLMLVHRGGAVSQITASATAMLSNSATLGCAEGTIALAPPVIGAETVLTQVMRPGPAAGGGDGLRARLRRSGLLRALHARMGGPRRAHRPYGPDPYAPMLHHVIETLLAGSRESSLLPPAASLAAVEVLSAARAAGNGAR
jgi:predicted dehydrogenase